MDWVVLRLVPLLRECTARSVCVVAVRDSEGSCCQCEKESGEHEGRRSEWQADDEEEKEERGEEERETREDSSSAWAPLLYSSRYRRFLTMQGDKEFHR